MERTAVLVLVLLVGGVVSSPLPVDPSTPTQSTPAEPTPSAALLVVAREEESLVPDNPLFYPEGGAVADPSLLMGVEEDDVDVLGGELMETANSGLVFRPQFRYRKQSRRRYNRNTRRPQFFAF